MKIKHTKCKLPTKRPCLMKNKFGELFLVTEGVGGQIYVTRMNSNSAKVNTRKSNLEGYTPLPKGTKVEIIN